MNNLSHPRTIPTPCATCNKAFESDFRYDALSNENVPTDSVCPTCEMEKDIAALLAAAKRSTSEEHEENCLSDAIFANVCPFCVGYRASALDAAVREVEKEMEAGK